MMINTNNVLKLSTIHLSSYLAYIVCSRLEQALKQTIHPALTHNEEKKNGSPQRHMRGEQIHGESGRVSV